MSIRRLSSYAFLVFLAVAVVWIAAGSRLSSQAMPQTPTVISGRNVNMVSGMTLPGGDPWLQRQNEPSIAVSSRNPLHLLAGANDYRTVDMPTSEGELPGKQPTAAVGDAWLGVFMSYDGGESWTSTMLPGFPQDSGNNPLKGYRAAADPVVRSGPNGLFYFSGIAFNRGTNLGVVFVARFIDDNNKENGGTIRYIDTKIIAKGTATKFLDKPWISVDQPRVPLTNITISGQTFPRHNVYIAYSSFSGTTTLLGDIMFARSTDCGTSWGNPIKLSTGSYAQQGATIAVKPVIGEVLVAWRRFGVSGRTPDTIYVAQSFSRGAAFQSPVKVADVTPFDQPTTDETQALPGTAAGPAFRTNSYPTIAVDKSGHVYLAWSQRGQGPSGDARIVLSASYFGSNWSVPQPVANVDENGLPLLGHQIMPSMTFAAGKLALVWVDQRNDISALQYGFNKWIIDSLFSAPYLNLRHTMDVWAAEAETSTFPNLVWKSSQVSRYLHALLRDQFGEIVYQNGLPVVFPVQFNCVNYPLFKGGHNPFNGDYIDIAASPSFRQDTWRNWIFNTDDQRDPVFHVAWADNRDVRPPLNGNWAVYAPPASSQASAYVSPEHPSCNPNGSGNEPGMRNQNIYTSRLTWGVVAGAPVNDKPLNLANGVARAFVVYVQNNTETLRHFRLSIAAQPAGGQASFDQFSLLSSLGVDIAPYSTISRTVFIRSSDANAPVTVNINEIDASGAIIADGLKSFVDINRDTSNPQMTGNQETHNPNIVNSANPNIVNWFINPNIVNPNIVNPNIVNPNIVNPNIVNPNIVNPNIVNPNIVNPNIVNPNIVNPNIVNPNIVNPNIVNPNIVNPNIVNPNIVNANPDDVTATDVEWTVKNEGTATTSYSLKTLAKKSPPQGVYVQLLVYRVHYTPAVTGAELKAEGVEACSLKQEPHHELVLNVVNPNIVNPNIVNPNIVNPNIVNADIENATFSVAPGEEVVVDLRVLDSGTSNVASSPQMAMGTMAAGVSTQAVTVDEFIQSLGFAVTSHAVNSVDVALGSQVPPADATDLVIGTASLPDGVVGYSYNAPLNAYGGAGSYVWSLNAGELPPGLSVAAGGAIVGTPTQAGTYQFIVRVDSGGQFDTQQYAVNIDSNTTPDPLNITTTSIPSGVQGVWYGATLQAVGGVWPRSWRLSSGALPEGVSLDSGGVISGTPAVTGSFGFTARVADRNGTIDTQTLTLVVAPETATYFDITGVVFNEGGAPLGGVVLRGLPNTPVTAADGTYADKVPAGWSGTAIPFAAGHTFSPASRTYTNLASSQSSENYNTPATPLTISGNVRLGAIGLVGVHMTGLPGEPTTDTSGTFLVSVNYGWSGSATPILSGYTFNPPSQTFTTITTDQSISFTAATLVGPASRLVFTQSPNGGIGGVVWSTQPMVEIQDAMGNRVTSDNTTQVTLHIFDDPGHGWLDGTTTITAVAGAASFAGLSIDKGGNGYTLQAASNTALDVATSTPFSIEGFMDAMNTLSVARQGLTATPVTLDGTDLILIAGGRAGTSITALLDFFNPIAKTFANPELAMIHPRTWHTATALLDGRILIVGGEPDPISSDSAEIFNPANGECTSTPWGPDYPRSNHRATLLQDGRVLITGSSLTDEPVAEIYDPKTGTFAEAGLMNAARYLHTSTLLPNGKVLITGGNDNANDGAILRSAELYDPATGEFTEISGGMAGGPRANHQATLLDNGKVLITGGDEGPTSSAEIYDSPTDTYPNGHFTSIGNMLYAHEGHQAALLRDGTVLLIGGNGISDGNEIYDPSSSIPFRETGPMSFDRTNGAVAVLPDGKVLITGGYSTGDGGGATDTAEVWIPRTPFPTHIVSGTITQGGVGVGGVMLVGLPGHPMTNAGGYYEGLAVDGWDGVVTPTKPGYVFSPAAYEYFDVISDMPNQNYFVTQAAAAKLAFVQSPTNTMVNSTITPAVTVEIQDALGNRVATATGAVILSLRNAGSAILGGIVSHEAVGGLATFSNLSIDTAGTGYLLRANSGILTESDSIPFNITAPLATKVQVETLPDGSGVIVPAQNVSAGSSIVVYAIARDASNNFIENVAADSWSLVNKTIGVVDGDLVPVEGNKSATFTGHLLGSAQIQAIKSGLTSTDSGLLAVTGGIAGKISLTGPARSGSGFLSEAFTITSQDGFGNPVNVATNTIFSLASNTTGTSTFYSDPAGATPITQATILAGLSSANFFYMDDVSGTPTVTATWISGGANLGASAYPFIVWAVLGQVTFASNRDGNFEIYLMNADGTGQTRLTDNSTIDEEPYWSPDGNKIVFTSHRDGNPEIYVMNADGSWQKRLTYNEVLDANPSWSPDGSKIAFQRNDGAYNIFVMNADGTNVTNLTNNAFDNYSASWSPDGSKLAFVSNPAGNTGIFVMNANGTGSTRLTAGPYDSYPCWSPDGSKIAFTSNWDIYVMNADGTGQTRLTSNGAYDMEPSWSPDGTRISFESERDGNAEIYVMNADGTGQTRLTNNSAFDGQACWGREKYELVTKWGSLGSGDGQFNTTMMGLTTDSSGSVYVVDTSNYRIQKFDSAGTFLGWWGLDDIGNGGWHGPGSGRTGRYGGGNGQFYAPQGIAVDPSGQINVTDNYLSNVQKFTQGGGYLSKWSSGYPVAIAIDSSGYAYIIDNNLGALVTYDPSGTFVTSWFVPSRGDVAVDNRGYLYIAGSDNQVHKYTTSGTLVAEWGSSGNGDGQFNSVTGLAVDSNGNVFVVDNGNNRIQKFTSAGAFITKWGSLGDGDGQFNFPRRIAIDNTGNVYITDSGNHRVQKFRIKS